MIKVLSIILLFTTTVFLVLLIRQLFLKGVLHFKLLKELYPREFKSYSSYWEFILPQNFFTVEMGKFMWLSIPFYYSRIKEDEMTAQALLLHRKLIKNNKKVFIRIILFIVNVVFIGLLGYALN